MKPAGQPIDWEAIVDDAWNCHPRGLLAYFSEIVDSEGGTAALNELLRLVELLRDAITDGHPLLLRRRDDYWDLYGSAIIITPDDVGPQESDLFRAFEVFDAVVPPPPFEEGGFVVRHSIWEIDGIAHDDPFGGLSI